MVRKVDVLKKVISMLRLTSSDLERAHRKKIEIAEGENINFALTNHVLRDNSEEIIITLEGSKELGN